MMKTNAKRVAIGLTLCKGQASHTAQRDAQTAQGAATGAALGAVGGWLGGVFSQPLPKGKSTAIGATGGALAGGADGADQAAQAWERARWECIHPLGHPVG